jgi:hypothetical protein
MAVDFMEKAAFLKDELEAFYHRVKPYTGETVQHQAIARLRTAVSRIETFAEGPGCLWKQLTVEQRWGYLTLASHVGTATYELIDCGRVQEILAHNQSESFVGLMSPARRSERLRRVPRSVSRRSAGPAHYWLPATIAPATATATTTRTTATATAARLAGFGFIDG